MQDGRFCGLKAAFRGSALHRHGSGGCGVEVTLQEDGGGHLVDFPFAVFVADVGGVEGAVGLGGGEAFVPGFDGEVKLGLEGGDEVADFGGGGAVGAVHVAGHADEDETGGFFAEDFLEAADDGGEGFGGDEFERVGEHAEFVADGDADADGAVVEGEDAHGTQNSAWVIGFVFTNGIKAWWGGNLHSISGRGVKWCGREG